MATLSVSFPRSSAPTLYSHQLLPCTLSMSTHQTPSVMLATKKLENINCIQQPTANVGGLYLGDIISVIKPDFIHKYQISAILTCISESDYSLNIPSQIVQKTISAKDSLDYPINIHFVECFQFIESMRKQNKNILVHCHAGVSRSAAIVCAYLMKKKMLTSAEALSYLKEKRPRVRPNQNFLQLLKQFQSNASQSNSHQFLGQDIKNQIRQDTQKPIINFRNSLDCQNPKIFNHTSSYNQLENSGHNSRNSMNIMKETDKTLPIRVRHRSIHYSPATSQKSYRDNDKDKQSRIKLGLSKVNSNLKNQEKQRDQNKIKKEMPKKQQLSFGQQFKNKISMLLGRKTRIPWELSKKNSDICLENESISIGCI